MSQYPPPQQGYYPPQQEGYYPPQQGYPQQGYPPQQQGYYQPAPPPQTIVMQQEPKKDDHSCCCGCSSQESYTLKSNIETNGAFQLELPNVKDRETILNLAKFSSNVYINSDDSNWYNLEPNWNLNESLGVESDGLRGLVFSNHDNSLVVIALKGSSATLSAGSPTGETNKKNANLLFSCCCAMISRAWTPVCDCYRDSVYVCETSCLQKNTSDADSYYSEAMKMYNQVQKMHPGSTIWITGHSVGGSLASLVGQTYGVPTITFGSPGERLAAQRLHLPQLTDNFPLWHFGHTADLIFTGECNGFGSSCWYSGYALETKCHSGKICVWDTVKNNGWGKSIQSHDIKDLIEKILLNPQGFPLPDCEEQKHCEDCAEWTYYDKRDDSLDIFV